MAVIDKNALGPFHRGGVETERLAALDNYKRSGSQRQRAFVCLAEAGTNGYTDFELAAAINHPRPHVAGTRRGELAKQGLVEDSGQRRPTDTGSAAIVWRLSDRGRRVYELLLLDE